MFNKKFLVFVFFSSFSAFANEGPTIAVEGGRDIILFGDSGTGSPDQYDVSKGIETYCTKAQCDFIAMLGDNIYDAGVSSVNDNQFLTKFEDPYSNLDFKFYVVLGNHDYGGNIQAEIDYTKLSKKWVMPERYFKLAGDDVDYFALDTENLDASQLQWIEKELKNSTAHWKIVYSHHPVFSGGLHGDSDLLKNKLLPLLTKYDVDFYLSGHDHDKQLIARSGLVFIVSGAAASVRTVTSVNGTIFAKSSLGACHLHLEDEKAQVTFFDKYGNQEFQKTFLKKASARASSLAQ